VVGNLGACSLHGVNKATSIIYTSESDSEIVAEFYNKCCPLVWQRYRPSSNIGISYSWFKHLFQHSSKGVRFAAVEVFASTYFASSKLAATDNHVFHSTDVIIPPLISMTLEDSDEGLRNRAAGLLFAICTSGRLPPDGTCDYFADSRKDSGCARRELSVPDNIHRLLDLLSAPRPLSATTAQLLSVLCEQNKRTQLHLLLIMPTWCLTLVPFVLQSASRSEHGLLIKLRSPETSLPISSRASLVCFPNSSAEVGTFIYQTYPNHR
jgi:hypothetical protein